MGQGTGPFDKDGYRTGISPYTFAPLDRAVVISDRPGGRCGVIFEAGDEMEMEMASSLPKSDGIHAVTGRQLAHQLAGLLDSRSPGAGLIKVEINGAAQMAAGVKKQPTQQRRRVWVVAQNPETCSTNLIGANRCAGAGVNTTDATRQCGRTREQGAMPLRAPQSQAGQQEQAMRPKEAMDKPG